LDESLSGAQWHFDAIVEFDAGLAVENDDHVDCFGGVHARPPPAANAAARSAGICPAPIDTGGDVSGSMVRVKTRQPPTGGRKGTTSGSIDSVADRSDSSDPHSIVS
jgi:hypothetical protein